MSSYWFCALDPGVTKTDWWLRNSRNLFLTVWKLQLRVPARSGEALFSARSQCLYMAEGARELLGVSSVRALIQFMRATPSCLSHLPKAPPTSTVTTGGQGFNIGHKRAEHSRRGHTGLQRTINPSLVSLKKRRTEESVLGRLAHT